MSENRVKGKTAVCRGCGRRDGTHENECRAVVREALKKSHATQREGAPRASYVKIKGLRDFAAYAVQLPSDNRWGFELARAEGEWSQSWPGGFGLATEWTTVPTTKVPAKVRAEMDWLFDQ